MKMERVLDLCRSFPGVTEDVKWGECRVFSIGGKMFAITDIDPQARRMSFKVDDDRFLELTDRPGFMPAPYLAKLRWVRVEDITLLPQDETTALLRRAYELIFAKLTKKAQREIAGQ